MNTKTFLFYLCLVTTSFPQIIKDTTYSIELNATISPSISFFRNPKFPGDTSKSSLGYNFFVRGMWHPGRMLSVGILTGYLHLSDDDNITKIEDDTQPKYSATLSAIPLQVVFSMQRLGTEAGLGVGPYFLFTSLNVDNEVANSSRLEFGITFWISHSFELTNRFKIAPEFKYLYLGYRGINSYMPSINFRYDLYRY